MQENKVDVRKLIKFGNSSFVVSLPSSWIKQHELKKGDNVYINETENGEIIIRNDTSGDKKEIKKIKIHVDSLDVDKVKRNIISAYVSGYNYLTLEGTLRDEMGDIEELIHNLLSLEIVEQTSNKTVVRDFLNIEEVAVSDILKRMDLIVRSMISDSKKCFNESLYNQINHRDLTVNKLRFLLLKTVRESLNNTRLKAVIEKSGISVWDVWMLLINLENIADESRRIARLLKDGKLDKKEEENILKIYDEIEESYLLVMKSLHKRDRELAHDVATRKNRIIEQCDMLFKKCKSKNAVSVIEKLKAMESYIRNMARVVIDQELPPLSNNKP